MRVSLEGWGVQRWFNSDQCWNLCPSSDLYAYIVILLLHILFISYYSVPYLFEDDQNL